MVLSGRELCQKREFQLSKLSWNVPFGWADRMQYRQLRVKMKLLCGGFVYLIPTRETYHSSQVSPAVLWANRSLAFRALTRSFFSLSSSYWHNMNLSLLQDDEGGLHVTLSRDTMALAFSLTFSP